MTDNDFIIRDQRGYESLYYEENNRWLYVGVIDVTHRRPGAIQFYTKGLAKWNTGDLLTPSEYERVLNRLLSFLHKYYTEIVLMDTQTETQENTRKLIKERLQSMISENWDLNQSEDEIVIRRK